MALHKMIKMITIGLGGEAYLNFMGNEFGHPEWIDFPRQGNNFSYHYCRRQWSLKYNANLRYGQLGEFDRVMIEWERRLKTMKSAHQYVSAQRFSDKVVVFERGKLLIVFNFHPYKSYENYMIGTHWGSSHIVLYDTDEARFGGFNRISHEVLFDVHDEPSMNRKHSLKLYIPSRVGIALIPIEFAKEYKDFLDIPNTNLLDDLYIAPKDIREEDDKKAATGDHSEEAKKEEANKEQPKAEEVKKQPEDAKGAGKAEEPKETEKEEAKQE